MLLDVSKLVSSGAQRAAPSTLVLACSINSLYNYDMKYGVHRSENQKDWGNPIVEKIYVSLAQADLQEDGRVADWLNANGFCNLTCCPRCHVDDFIHVEGCQMGDALDLILKLLEQQKPALDQAIEQHFRGGRP